MSANTIDIEGILAGRVGMHMVAQPIVNLAGGSIAGYELLARFDLPGIGPDRVFAAAHACGSGAALSARVVEIALEAAAQVPANTFATINIDPLVLGTPEVEAVLARAPLDGVVLELTEHHAIDDLDALRARLDKLRTRGAFIALDDAGAGYSGLKQVLGLAPDFIKLDRDLISNLHENETKRVLVMMLGELAARLDAWLIAEGIETDLEHDAIVKLGAPLAQGYRYARPAPIWCGLEPEVRRLLEAARVRSFIVDHTTVARLVAPCPISDSGTQTSVALDHHHRPTLLKLPRGTRALHEVMRIKRDAEVAEVARRALARPEVYRWDPLVCVDDAGRFEGLVAIERLVEALAELVEMPRMARATTIPIAVTRAATR